MSASELSDYELINEGIPPEHLVAPYGDPNKMLGQNGQLIDKLPKGTKVRRTRSPPPSCRWATW